MKTFEEFYSESDKHIELFNEFATKHSLEGKSRADHICYKCSTTESYESLRAMLENASNYVFQSIISNRRIAIIRLKQGIETSLGTINFVELSDQKPDNSQKEGFDHIEVYPVGISYDEMISELEKTEKVIKIERPHHTTHDIDLEGFIFRCEQGPLIEKIKESEMV